MSKYIWRSVSALLLMLFCAFYFQYSERIKLQSIHQTRAARVKLQISEQQQSVLEQHKEHALLDVLGEDISIVQIRLAEYLSSFQKVEIQPGRDNTQYAKSQNQQAAASAQGAGSSVDSLADNAANSAANTVVSYQQSVLPDDLQLSADVDLANAALFRVRTLRVDVKIQISNTPDMLSFLRKLKSAAGGWAGEIQACEMRRSFRSGLDARCVVDFYHWTVRTDVANDT